MDNLNVKVNSAGVAASTPSSSSVKTENTTQTTVFAGQAKKDKSKLTENEIKYLVSQGYDISSMTEEDIEKALVPLYQSAETKAEQPAPAPQSALSAPAAEAPAPTVEFTATETPTAEAPSTAAPSASTVEAPAVEAKNTAYVAAQQKSEKQAFVQTQEETTTTAQTEAKKEADAPKRFSPKEIKVDYNTEESRKLIYELGTIKEGVSACDYYSKLTPEEQAQIFVKALAMKTCGEQWQSMTEEEQAQAMQTIEADLAEKIPSWNKLTTEDKAKLGLAFAYTEDKEALALRYDGDFEKNCTKVFETSLDKQIEKVASRIVIGKKIKTYMALGEAFNKEISTRYGDSKEAKRNLLENQFTYLQEKQASGKELNKFESHKLETLQKAKAMFGEKWQEMISEHLNLDRETSTYKQMIDDPHYKEMFEKSRQGYYENISDWDEAGIKAAKDAQKDWIKHQFEGMDPYGADQEAFDKKFKELRDNCHTIEEQIELAILCGEIYKNKDFKMCDDHGAKVTALGAVRTDEHGNINEEAVMQTVTDLDAAVREGKVSGEAVGHITRGISEVTAKEAPNITARAVTGLLDIEDKEAHAARAVTEATRDGVYSTDLQKEIYTGALDSVKNKESLNVLARGIGYTDDSIELDISRGYNKFAVDTKNSDMMVSLGEGLRFYSKDNQLLVMQDLMESSYSFDDKVAVSLQKGFADQVQYAHKDNRLELHKQVMGSKFEDVQTHAAKNIQYYDNSVKSKAIDAVYETGNTQAIEAVREIVPALPPEIQKDEIIRALAEAVISGGLSKGDADVKILSGTLSIHEISQLSPKERREYFIKRFEEASASKKLAIMKSLVGSTLIGAIHKKHLYAVIARSPFLKNLVESGMGKSMLEAGLPIDAANKVINAMRISTNGTVIEQRKELAKDPSFRTYFEGTFEEADHLVKNESKQKYATPISTEFMKEAFTPVFIDAKTRAELMKNKSTMYIKS